MSNDYPTYEGALEAAGAKVFKYIETGSYQGDWYALVRYNGALGFVHGSYGSCSGCDALQGELDTYDWSLDNPDCKKQYEDFGRSYLEGSFYSQEELIKEIEASMWDGSDNKEFLDWLKETDISVKAL